jgi:drug/metabolite transporter (DMT)-like permease
MQTHSYRAAVMALASAALFGASTPFAKLLLGGGVDPWLLAGLLYLGSGLGLGVVHLTQRMRNNSAEASLERQDLPWLCLVVVTGGVIGPVLLMLGLTLTTASTAALLLTVEGLATMAIAWLVFKEHVDRRLLLGAFAILAGAVVLSWQGGLSEVGLGALAVIGACIAWGIDNNLTRKLSASDPVQIAMIKGLAAGAVNLALAFGRGAALPPSGGLAAAGVVGFFGYGISLVLFVLALRHLGSARTGAYFSTAPFLGALLAIGLLHEPVTLALVVAAVLMSFGVYLHLTERHKHAHTHGALEHAHRHVHDDHHQHQHAPEDPIGEPHNHAHRHRTITHDHAHYPDIHHRHRHGPKH